MALPYSFSANTSPTGVQLDANQAALGAQGIVPCTVSGTNTLTLTQLSNTSTVAAYANYNKYSGIAAATNTGAMTARVGALAALNVYKGGPAAPVACAGGELIIGCAFTLTYDSALNSGAGGFHLTSTTEAITSGGGTVTNNIAVTDGASFTAQMGSSSLTAASVVASSGLFVGASSIAASVTRIVTRLATLTYTVIPANSTQAQNATLTGVQTGDAIMLGLPSLTSGLVGTAFVPATGTISVRMGNVTAASIAAFTLTNVRLTAMGNT